MRGNIFLQPDKCFPVVCLPFGERQHIIWSVAANGLLALEQETSFFFLKNAGIRKSQWLHVYWNLGLKFFPIFFASLKKKVRLSNFVCWTFTPKRTKFKVIKNRMYTWLAFLYRTHLSLNLQDYSSPPFWRMRENPAHTPSSIYSAHQSTFLSWFVFMSSSRNSCSFSSLFFPFLLASCNCDW